MVALRVLFALFINGFVFGHAGFMETAWRNEIVYDWENLDHLVAFKHWQQEFDKIYGDAKEEAHRFLVFLDNWKMINDFNSARNRNFSLRLNQFGDLTGEEFRYYVHGHSESCLKTKNITKSKNKLNGIQLSSTNNTATPSPLPEAIDWTDYNGQSYVTPVKNQGQCGSCWV